LKNAKALPLIVFLLLPGFVLGTNVLAQDYSVGVKEGDWVKYDVTATGPGPQLITWMKVEILGFLGENVTLGLTTHSQNGNETYQTITFNLTAMGSGGYSFVVPANLSVRDHVNVGGGVRSITSEMTRICVGANRTVIKTVFSDSGNTYSYYFDRQTGVAIEIIEVSGAGSWTSDIVAEDTNIWVIASPRTDWWPWIVATAIIVVIAVVVASRLRKRRARHRRRS
jgi:hypothetical protein